MKEGEQRMIPKVINYCWFGGNPLPESAVKCIASWKKFFPEYEIKEWNEENFDLEICDYVKEAYQAKKWAFVSDYARFWILYYYGGLYFDTDVEVIKDMSKIVESGSFMGCEATYDKGKASLMVNPGLGLGAEPGLKLYREMLDLYGTLKFINKDGTLNEQTVVGYTTGMLKKYGFVGNGRGEKISEIQVYPQEYFCPLNYATGELNITENTVSIHHYTASWHSTLDNLICQIEQCDYVNHPLEYKIRRVLSFGFRVINKVKKNGMKETVKLVLNKLSVENTHK